MHHRDSPAFLGPVLSILDTLAAISLTILSFAYFFGAAGGWFLGVSYSTSDLALVLSVMCGIQVGLLLAGIAWCSTWLAATRVVTGLLLFSLATLAFAVFDLRTGPTWMEQLVIATSAATVVTAAVGLLSPVSQKKNHDHSTVCASDLPESIRRSLK